MQRTSIHKSFFWFLYPFFLFLLVGLPIIVLTEKGAVVLAINKFSNTWLDAFFLVATDFGLGNVAALIGILLLLYRIRWGLLALTSLIWTSIFTNLFKRVLFPDTSRPFHYFYYDDFTRFIHDAPLIYYNSFPSGHTMTIFALCCVLAYLAKKRTLSLLLFFVALLVGISRIYLLQHFFVDMYTGAILGVIAMGISVWIIDKKLQLNNKPSFNKSLFSLFRKGHNQ